MGDLGIVQSYKADQAGMLQNKNPGGVLEDGIEIASGKEIKEPGKYLLNCKDGTLIKFEIAKPGAQGAGNATDPGDVKLEVSAGGIRPADIKKQPTSNSAVFNAALKEYGAPTVSENPIKGVPGNPKSTVTATWSSKQNEYGVSGGIQGSITKGTDASGDSGSVPGERTIGVFVKKDTSVPEPK
jgi:hypothetical protein